MHQKRIKKVQEKLGSLSAIAIVDPINLLYFCGEEVESALLIIKKRSVKLYARKMLLSQYAHLDAHEWKETLKVSGTIGFVERSLSYLQYQKLRAMGKLKKSTIIDEVRAIKDANELRSLYKSANLVTMGMKHIAQWIEPGMSEKEVEVEIERFGCANGASRVSFSPIVASGKMSAYPHYRASEKKIAKNCGVKLDFGYVVDGYCSDMTRVIAVGRMPACLADMVEKVKFASEKVYQACRPGVCVKELDHIARKALGKEAKLFIHGLGHGIGLEVHEPPSFYKKGEIEKGMVLALEPGLYLPNVGGARYENMVEVTSSGCNIMTPLDI